MSEQLPGADPSAVEPVRTPEPDDEALRRVRAADPAAGAAPDPARLAATLRAATGVDVGDLTAADDPASRTVGAGPALAAAHRRWSVRQRPARWWQVAAVVAALAVVGGGGYALGARTDGGSAAVGGSTPLPAIALGGGAQRSGAESAAGTSSGAASSLAVGAPSTAVRWGSRTVFTASGLSTAGGSAAAYAFDAASVVSADTVRRVAKVLALSGEPQAQWGTWTVGALDGTGPALRLSGDGMATLSYDDPAWDPWTCVGDKASAAAGACGRTGGAPAPTGDAAVAKVRNLLTSLGVDLTGAQAHVASQPSKVQDATGATVPAADRVVVTFSQVVEGQLTGVSWSATLVGSGVQSLWGPLAPLVDLGRYQVVSPAAAAARLNDPRFGAFMSGPVPLAADGSGAEAATGAASVAAPSTAVGAAASGTPAAETPAAGTAAAGTAGTGTGTAEPGVVVVAPTPGATSVPATTAVPGGGPVPAPSATLPPVAPSTPKAGGAIAWPVRQVTLVSARLGLAVTTLPSGAAVLVPSYLLTDSDGGTWSVIAVADSQLDMTAPSR